MEGHVNRKRGLSRLGFVLLRVFWFVYFEFWEKLSSIVLIQLTTFMNCYEPTCLYSSNHYKTCEVGY